MATRKMFELFTVLQCAVSVVPMVVLLLMLLILFWRLTNGTRTSDAMCVKVLSGVVAGRGQLRPSQARSSLCVFPEPDGTQFLPLVLPINSQIATLRAPEVQSQLAGLFTTHRQRHSSVPAVGCLCHGHHANETTSKCLSAKQKGTKRSVQSVLLLRVFRQNELAITRLKNT